MRTRRLPHRGVVADPEQHAARRRRALDDRANGRDEVVFASRLGVPSRERRADARSSAPRIGRAEDARSPSTSTSAPASTTARVVARRCRRRLRSHAGLRASISARASRTFSSARGMNCWPPKPGFTLITSTMSQSSMMSSSIATGVCGQIAMPAFAPSERMCVSRRCACGVASRWNVMMSAAGFAKIVDVALRLDDHQVRVERQRRQLAQVADDLRPPGDVRNEAAVHDVEMQVVRAGRFDDGDLLGDAREVGREQRRRDERRPLRCLPATATADGFMS